MRITPEVELAGTLPAHDELAQEPARPAILERMASVARRVMGWKTGLSIFDQAVVSGASFMTTVLLGRMCGPAELGVYSLGFTLVLMIASVQTALISVPYTIYSNRLSTGARREYAGSVFVHYLLLAGVVAVGFALAAGIGVFVAGQSSLIPVLGVLAGVIPFLLLREFVRRFAFAHLQLWTATALDVAVATLQIAGLLILAFTGRLTAASGYAVIGLACAVAGIATLLLMRSALTVRREQVLPELGKNWRLGRWIVASHATVILQGYIIHWLLAGMLGPDATGVYAACLTVLLLANPLMIGVGNILEPKAAHALADGGSEGLRRVVWGTTTMLAGLMAFYCGLAALIGGPLVEWVYDGPEFAAQGPTVAVLALGFFVGSLDLGASHGLRVIERADMAFKASLLALGVTVAVAFALIEPLGTVGGAWALFAGSTAGAAFRCTAFARLAPSWQPRADAVHPH